MEPGPSAARLKPWAVLFGPLRGVIKSPCKGAGERRRAAVPVDPRQIVKGCNVTKRKGEEIAINVNPGGLNSGPERAAAVVGCCLFHDLLNLVIWGRSGVRSRPGVNPSP